jgi:UDP-glucose 4-epimerase
VPRFVEQALKGQPITVYGDGTQRRCFGHVADIVAALVGLIDSREAEGQVFNVGAQEEISIADLAQRVIDQLGSSSPIVKISYDEAYEEGFEDMPRRRPDTARIKALLGWEPKRGLDQIIADVAADISSR